jgi:hypothetical protein
MDNKMDRDLYDKFKEIYYAESTRVKSFYYYGKLLNIPDKKLFDLWDILYKRKCIALSLLKESMNERDAIEELFTNRWKDLG